MMLFRKTWKHKITGAEGNCTIFGVNIFDYQWHHTGEKVIVTDCVYHQRHVFNVYTVHLNGRVRTFAAGEFSNGVWGFYTKR